MSKAYLGLREAGNEKVHSEDPLLVNLGVDASFMGISCTGQTTKYKDSNAESLPFDIEFIISNNPRRQGIEIHYFVTSRRPREIRSTYHRQLQSDLPAKL